MAAEYRLRFDRPDAVGADNVRYAFVLLGGMPEGRLLITVIDGSDADGSFRFVPRGDMASGWWGAWRAESGAVVIQELTVNRYDGVTKDYLRKLPFGRLVRQAVAQLVGGEARALLVAQAETLFAGQPERLQIAIGALDRLNSELAASGGTAAMEPSGHRLGRPSASPTQKRGWAMSVVDLSTRPTARTGLYTALSDLWGRAEGQHLAPESARSRVNVLVREHWLVRAGRGEFAFGPLYLQTMGVPLE